MGPHSTTVRLSSAGSRLRSYPPSRPHKPLERLQTPSRPHLRPTFSIERAQGFWRVLHRSIGLLPQAEVTLAPLHYTMYVSSSWGLGPPTVSTFLKHASQM